MSAKKNELAIVEVPFHADRIQAVQNADGAVFVGIKRICESLGIDFSSQRTKLKREHWASVVIITTEASHGDSRKMAFLPLDHLPMWLVTINAGKVAERLRAKLKADQIEARDVLARHFFGDLGKPGPERAAKIPRVGEALLAQARAIHGHEKRLDAVEKTAKRANHKAELAAAMIEEYDAKRDKILDKISKKPAPGVAPPRSTWRSSLREHIVAYCEVHNMHDKEGFHRCYERLHRTYKQRAKIDLPQRARNLNAKGTKNTVEHSKPWTGLTVAVKLKKIEELYALCLKIFPLDPPEPKLRVHQG